MKVYVVQVGSIYSNPLGIARFFSIFTEGGILEWD